MIIKMNDIDISNLLLSYKRSGSMNRIVGNAPTTSLKISVDNETLIFDYKTVQSAVFEVQPTPTSKKYFYKAYEMPETWDGIIELTLYDCLHVFDVNYNTKLQYPTTIEEQLYEMQDITGINIDFSEVEKSILNKVINQYDTTIAMRSYLMWIAELSGCNIFSSNTTYGKIVFQKLNTSVSVKYDYLLDYKLGNLYHISQVMFNDGIRIYYEGVQTDNVYYLSNDNIYINSQEDISVVASTLMGLTLYSATNVNVDYHNIEFGSIVNCLDKFNFIVLDFEEQYFGGEEPDLLMNGELATKNQERIGVKVSDKVRIRRLKVIVDENDAKLSILSQQVDNFENQLGEFSVGFDEIKGEVSKVVDTIYKFETGSNNIFEKCNQTLVKTKDEIDIKRKSDMPLGINKDYMQGKDVVISADINVKNAKFSDLGNFIGAEFDIRYKDGTTKTYFTKWYLGQFLFQYLLQTDTSSHFERIWMHYKIDDKEIDSVSNLRMIIALNAEQATISYPKVEFGTQPTGFEFDMNYIRDNIETIQKDYTLIEQKIDTLTLKAVSMEEQITTIKGDVSSVTTRIQSAEIKLQPTNILLAVNEKIGADGKLYTTKFILDKLGAHISGGGLDISNNSGAKVLYADTEGNLTIVNLTAVNGKFTGTITGSTINGSTINTDKDLYVGNRIFLGNQNDSQEKFIYLKNSYVMKLSSSGDIYIQNPYTRLGLLNQTHGLASGFSVESKYAIGLYSGLAPGDAGVVGASITITGQSNTSSKNTIHIDAQSHIYASRSIEVGSDVRLKENFSDINLKNIFNYINVKSFNYIHSSKRTVGVIAQDFIDTPYEDIIVSKNKDGYYSVDYNVFTMALIQEVMYLREQIRNMQIDFARIGGLYSALNN